MYKKLILIRTKIEGLNKIARLQGIRENVTASPHTEKNMQI
jgi:hypothetical protein